MRAEPAEGGEQSDAEPRGEAGVSEGGDRAEKREPVAENFLRTGEVEVGEAVPAVDGKAQRVTDDDEGGQGAPAEELRAAAGAPQHRGAERPDQQAMGERQRREHGAKTRDEPCGARAVREGGDSRAHVEQHLEMIDRRAGPEKVFVVLKLKQAEREDEAEPETAGGAAGSDDQNGAQREETAIPEQTNDGKIHGAGEPVAGSEK